MLNIFKSPKKETPIVRDETSLLVKQFNGLNIQVLHMKTHFSRQKT